MRDGCCVLYIRRLDEQYRQDLGFGLDPVQDAPVDLMHGVGNLAKQDFALATDHFGSACAATTQFARH
jgi:hypothetical protein